MKDRIDRWGSNGGGFGGVVVVEDGFGEHEGAILGLLLVVVFVLLGGAEVDAGAPLERGEERRGHARPHPARHALELLVREDARVLHLAHGDRRRRRR